MFALIYVLGDYIYYSKQLTPVEILKSDFPLNMKEKKIFEIFNTSFLDTTLQRTQKNFFFKTSIKSILFLWKENIINGMSKLWGQYGQAQLQSK